MELRRSIETMMDRAWRPPGFCVPNRTTYPHQWLWDSCFHALVWSALGSDRGVSEVEAALANQGGDGFVPHMTYWTEPDLHAEFWGRSGTSSITQPPMYGHAIAELLRAGHQVPDRTVDRAVAGLLHLGHRTRTPAGLIPVFHPWETGCDDSARWDWWLHGERTYDKAPIGDNAPSDHEADLLTGDTADRTTAWREVKGRLVAAIERSATGGPTGNRLFTVGSIGFNALVAWNAVELLHVGVDHPELAVLAQEVTDAVRSRWQIDRWIDDGPPSGRIRTLDSMTALLVDPRHEAFDALVDPGAFGAPFGPRGAHRAEPSYRPDRYWRGPAWPQLGYLVMVAARRVGHTSAPTLARSLVAGAERSGLAEYWNPETGEGLGARPQTWAGLALLA